MGVRTYETAPDRPPPRPGPDPAATFLVGGLAVALLLANGRPIGAPQLEGIAGALLQAVLVPVGVVFELDETGRALVGKILAALCAGVAAGALFAAVTRRHALGDARASGVVLAVGTTLAAASQSWTGEAPATAAVAVALLLLTRASADDDPAPAARAAVPLGVAVLLAPSTWALALVLLAGTLVRWWRSGLMLLAWTVGGVLLAGLGLAIGRTAPGPPGDSGGLALLFSPADGLFVFAPVAVVGLAGVARAVRPPRARHRWDEAVSAPWLPLTAGTAAVAHVAAVALDGGWSVGPFWGPRLLAPLWPALLLFLPEGLALLRVAGSVLVALSVAVQALGALSYDGRWDRLYGSDPEAMWDLARSPILFQIRERVVRLALPAVEGNRLVVREHPLVLGGATGSRVTFPVAGPFLEGADATLGDVLLEGGARVVDGRLRLQGPADALFFRVPSGARLRSLELRVVGTGSGTLAVTEKTFWTPGTVHEHTVGGSFRVRAPWSYADSGGGDIRIAPRDGSLEIASVALVPPGEPENVIRLR
ncbi:MAG: hypothetical protein LJF30_13650 [Acidobacteria bacterium]|jgi:hypothetical protein|nr:hypothetical protein [Acidobacteriota bacterium]